MTQEQSSSRQNQSPRPNNPLRILQNVLQSGSQIQFEELFPQLRNLHPEEWGAFLQLEFERLGLNDQPESASDLKKCFPQLADLIEELLQSSAARPSTSVERGIPTVIQDCAEYPPSNEPPAKEVLLQNGDEVGDCRILDKLGQGGMGVVYRARHVRLHDLRAVKVLPRDAVTEDAIERFRQEAMAAARIRHPHVIRVHDVGERDGVYYIVMEYIEGKTIQQYVDQHMLRTQGAPFPWKTAIEFALPVLNALSQMHTERLVHRDIKPSNIMVSETMSQATHIVLMDFGLVQDARRPELGVIAGTPAYMPPEQAQTGRVDRRADIYSVGATLYFMLAGKPPYSSKVLQRLRSGERPQPIRVIRPDIPQDLAAIIEKSMAHAPGNRYRDAFEMSRALNRLLGGSELREREVSTTSEIRGEVFLTPHISNPTQEDTKPRVDDVTEPFLVPVADEEPVTLSGVSPKKQKTKLLSPEIKYLGVGLLCLAIAIPLLVWGLGNQNESTPGTVDNQDTPPPDTEGMVHIPAGTAYLGDTEETLRRHTQSLPRDQSLVLAEDFEIADQFVEACLQEPYVERHVNAFWIDPYEVTNAEYAEFVEKTGHGPPEHWQGSRPPLGLEEHPVVNVTYEDAQAYAAFRGKQLPTVDQWMRAYRGNDRRMYAWGNDWDTERTNVLQSPTSGTTNVTGTPRDVSPFEVYNMVGNVSEILRDKAPHEGAMRPVVKGASTLRDGTVYGAAPMRMYLFNEDPSTGFRCVIEEN